MAAILAYAASAMRTSSRAVERNRAKWNVGKVARKSISPTLTVAGWACMVTAAFFASTITGFVVAGIAFWAIEWGVRE